MMPLGRSEVKMYLSQVEIDRHNRRKTRDLTHAGAFHAWVEESFPQEIADHERTRKLWRTDRLAGKEYLLVVSEQKPNLEALEKYGVKDTARTKDYGPFLASLKEGGRYRFRVTLNPVVAVKVDTQDRGRVMPHVTVAQQMQFLADRAEKNGFSLREDEFTITERGYAAFKRGGQRPIRLSKATYEGVLTITDASKFRELLTRGMGKKKAYGFGMMTVIPMPEAR